MGWVAVALWVAVYLMRPKDSLDDWAIDDGLASGQLRHGG